MDGGSIYCTSEVRYVSGHEAGQALALALQNGQPALGPEGGAAAD